MRDGGREWRGGGGREGEGVSEEGRKVYFNQGRRDGEGVCNLSGTCMAKNLAAVKGCFKPNRYMCSVQGT